MKNLTFENDLDGAKLNQRARYLGQSQRSFRSKVAGQTLSHTHRTGCSIRATKVVGKNRTST